MAPIRIRLSAKHLQALVHGYTAAIPLFPTDTDHSALLYECMAHFYYRLVYQLKKGRKSNTIKFAGADGLAFFQYWQMIDTSTMPLTTITINRIVAKLHHRHIDLDRKLLSQVN